MFWFAMHRCISLFIDAMFVGHALYSGKTLPKRWDGISNFFLLPYISYYYVPSGFFLFEYKHYLKIEHHVAKLC